MVAGIVCIPLHRQDKTSCAPSKHENTADLSLRQYVIGPENCLLKDLPTHILHGDRIGFPLLLHGPSGTGKTVLLHSLLNRWAAEDHSRHLVCCTGKDFARFASNRLGADAMPWSTESAAGLNFSQTNNRLPGQIQSNTSINQELLLFVDNLEELKGRSVAQRYLCLVLDHLDSIQGRFVATSRRPPSDLSLEPNLQSRLAAGLVLAVQQPKVKSRAVLLAKIAASRQLTLTPPVASQLADCLPVGFTQLRNAVMKLEQQIAPSTNITQPDVDLYLDSLSIPSSLRQLAQLVCQHCMISMKELKSKSRQKCYVRARSFFIFFARTAVHATYVDIATFLGGRNETTVSHAFKKCCIKLNEDTDWSWSIQQLQRQLSAR